MMAEGGDFKDNANVRVDSGLRGDDNEGKERPFSQHLGAEERDAGFLMPRGSNRVFREGVNHGQFRFQTLPWFSDQGFPMRDADTTSSRFQWTNFLQGSKGLKVDEMKEDLQDCIYDNHGRNCMRADEKSIPNESERSRKFSNYAHCVGIPDPNELTRSLSAADFIGHGNIFRVREYLPHQDREMLTRSCTPGFYSLDSSPCLTPRSQSSGQHTPPRGILVDTGLDKEIYRPADGCAKGYNVQQTNCDDYQRKLCCTNVHPLSNKAINYPWAEYTPSMGRLDDYIHPASPRFGRPSPRVLSEGPNQKVQNAWDYHEHVRNDALDCNLQGHVNIHNSPGYMLRKDGLQSSGDALQAMPAIDNYDPRLHTGETMCENKVIFAPRNTHHKYESHETDAIGGYRALPHEEAYNYEVSTRDIWREDQDCYVTGQQQAVDADTQRDLESEDFVCTEQCERTLKRKHRLVGTSRPKRKFTTIGGRGALGHDEILSVEAEQKYFPSIRSSSKHGELQARENMRVSKTEIGLPFGGLSEALQRRLSKPHDPGRGDIKKRLKHPQAVRDACQFENSKFWKKYPKFVKPHSSVFNTISAPKPPGSSKVTKFKKSFKSASETDFETPTIQDPEFLHPDYNIEKIHQFSIQNFGSRNEACHLQGDLDLLKLKVNPADKDLPEHSEEFKRQEHEWFLKSMHFLNANLGWQKRLKGQGKAGSLRCIICSSSKEFMEMKDVAMHAFASPKVGLRAQHLGFHAAICVLMGWDMAVGPNNHWFCRPLPGAEACALKEDIIIWPPVVIVLKGCVGHYQLNDQVKIIAELLKNILRDEGFNEGKTKLCPGKPGNQGITVVKFSGTLSGLQEAERLHNFFSNKKHGRNELQRTTAKLTSCEDAQVPSNKVEEDALYGYLGIIEDLDKLHFDVKKHCCAKSRKEILAFADATASQ